MIKKYIAFQSDITKSQKCMYLVKNIAFNIIIYIKSFQWSVIQ